MSWEAPCIVALGTLSDGWRYFGPFPSWEDASDWADRFTDMTWVITLEEPV